MVLIFAGGGGVCEGNTAKIIHMQKFPRLQYKICNKYTYLAESVMGTWK